MIAFRPEPHTLLIVVADVPFGRPALSAAWRAGACPTPACRTWPIRTSSTVAVVGSRPARSTAARMATPPRSVAGTADSAPPNLPMGVRAALRDRRGRSGRDRAGSWPESTPRSGRASRGLLRASSVFCLADLVGHAAPGAAIPCTVRASRPVPRSRVPAIRLRSARWPTRRSRPAGERPRFEHGARSRRCRSTLGPALEAELPVPEAAERARHGRLTKRRCSTAVMSTRCRGQPALRPIRGR